MSALKVIRPRKDAQSPEIDGELRGLGDSAVLSVRALEPYLVIDHIDEKLAQEIADLYKIRFNVLIDEQSRKLGLFTLNAPEANPIVSMVKLLACTFSLTKDDSSVSCYIGSLPRMHSIMMNEGHILPHTEVASSEVSNLDLNWKNLKVDESLMVMLKANTAGTSFDENLLQENIPYSDLGRLFKTQTKVASAKFRS